MCDICVMDAVKQRMLSRRDLFRGTAAVAATAAVGSVASAPPALAGGHGGIVDMTHAFSDAFPTWGGAPTPRG